MAPFEQSHEPPLAHSIWPYIIGAPLLHIVAAVILLCAFILVAMAVLLLQKIIQSLISLIKSLKNTPLILYAAVAVLVSTTFEILDACYYMAGMLCWILGARRCIRPPRYRQGDPFARSSICDRCKNMIRGSSLLIGSWKIFVWPLEWHPFYATMDELRESSANCQLCHVLANSTPSFSAVGYDSTPSLGSVYDWTTNDPSLDGTRAPAQGSGPRLTIKIWASLPLRVQPCTFLQLYRSGEALSEILRTGEGPLPSDVTTWYNTGSHDTLSKAKGWIESCSQHAACEKLSSASKFCPTRLLRVGTEQHPELCLVERLESLVAKEKAGEETDREETDREETDQEETDQEEKTYLVLSHCWGGEIQCKLKQERLDAMKKAISIDALPRTFRDAVLITRKLGVPYLWIDSLCIIQDSDDDWKREAVQMADVFAHALCTIAATASSSSLEGCFRNRSDPAFRWTLMTKLTGGGSRLFVKMDTPTVQSLFETRVEQAPLNSRAWVFQERLISRRILHFSSDSVLFECRSKRTSEFHTAGVEYAIRPRLMEEHGGGDVLWADDERRPILEENRSDDRGYGSESLGRRRGALANQGFSHDGIRGALDYLRLFDTTDASTAPSMEQKIEFNKRWYDLVRVYTLCALTKPEDRLVALEGIAQVVMAGTQRKAPGPYIAGLWSSLCPEFGLLWKSKRPGPMPDAVPDWAPSWSWACVHGPVELLLGQMLLRHADKFVFHTQVERITSSPDAILDIAGPALSTTSSTVPILMDGCPQEVTYFLDWSRPRVSRKEFVLVHVLTVRRQHFGLVLRPISSATVAAMEEYRRVGVFRAVGEAFPSIEESQPPAWTRRSFRVV